MTQLSATPPQSASLTQSRCAWPEPSEQVLFVGPTVQMPAPSPPSAQSRRFTVLVSSRQALGRGAAPGTPQALPGHDDDAAHASPVLAPPRQREPPQMPGAPPLAGQAAQGIYVQEGDILKLCYTMPGGKRPTAFESAAGSEAYFIIWQASRK